MATTTTSPTARPRRHLGRGARRAVLSAHVISAVGLLGASSALLVLAIAGATTADPELERSAYRFVGIFGLVFGIPLSFSALFTGVTLGLGTKWGVLRYPWVMTKLVLLVTTILSGALVIGPLAERMIDDGGRPGDARRRGRLQRARAADLDGAVGLQARRPPAARPVAAQREARQRIVPDLQVWIVRPLARSVVRSLSENVPRAPREPSSRREAVVDVRRPSRPR